MEAWLTYGVALQHFAPFLYAWKLTLWRDLFSKWMEGFDGIDVNGDTLDEVDIVDTWEFDVIV